jgi:hypothetical protein
MLAKFSPIVNEIKRMSLTFESSRIRVFVPAEAGAMIIRQTQLQGNSNFEQKWIKMRSINLSN